MSEFQCYSVPHVARLLDCSQRTVWRRIADQTIKAVRVGSSVRISHAELSRFLEGSQDAK
jgi:excisionase family DNA binding protein